MPGYVESQMCAEMPGPKPFLWPASRAARTIRSGLARNRARISFPFPLNLGCFLLSVLHPSASGRILKWLGYGGRSEEPTSELQSLIRISYDVFWLKNKKQRIPTTKNEHEIK